MFTLKEKQIEVTTSVSLGLNVFWDQDSELLSNSSYVSLVAEKMSNGTIFLSFGGGN